MTSLGILADEDILRAGGSADGAELRANKQAADWILPEDTPLPPGRPRLTTVLEIADRYQVHVSFVIGRIQHAHADWGYLRRSIPRVLPHIAVEP